MNNNKRELAEHHIQTQILKEIEMELEKFIQYAETIGQEEIAVIYRKTLNIIKGILKLKSKNLETMERVNEDEVYSSIKSYLKDFTPRE